MKFYNINIFRSTIYINKLQCDIIDKNNMLINGNLYNYYLYENKIIFLFNFTVDKLKQFLIILFFCANNNIYFDIGNNFFNNLFYVIVDYVNINQIKTINDDYKINIDIIKNVNKYIDNKNIIYDSFSKIYDIGENKIIKIGYFNIALNEIINHHKIKTLTKNIDLSCKIINFNSFVFFVNDKINLMINDLFNQKIIIGVVMNYYHKIENCLSHKNYDKCKLNNFINDITKLNENKIFLIDLKLNNVLWDDINKQFVLIDFDALKFTEVVRDDELITSGYNTNLAYKHGYSNKYTDFYGLNDIIYYFMGINLCKFIYYFGHRFNLINDKISKIDNIHEIRLKMINIDSNVLNKIIDDYRKLYCS
jgi:hypothetical protein